MRRNMKRIMALAVSMVAALPALAHAAAGKAADLVVVADTRVIDSGILRYFADLYNTNPTMNATWAVVLTAVYGCFLGVLMDFLLSRTGLDLTSRKIVEH